MAVTINASTSAGLVNTADTSGVLALQTAGTTAVTVDASQNVTLAGTLTTTGVTTVQAGTAALPAITTSGDTNTGIFFPAADTIAFSEGGVESMRINSSGNVGIGTASPANRLNAYDASAKAAILANGYSLVGANANTNNGCVQVGANGSATLLLDIDGVTGGTATASIYNTYAGPLRFGTSNSERMRIDSTGNVGIGITAITGKLHVLAGSVAEFLVGYNGTSFNYYDADNQIFRSAGKTEAMRISSGALIVNSSVNSAALTGNAKLSIWNTPTGASGFATGYGQSGGEFRLMYLSNSNILNFDNGLNVGTLNSAGAWINASDARLKKNIRTIEYGLNTVLGLQPRHFERVDVEGTFIGFVAQELQTIIPEVVNGDPEKQLGVDYGSLVAVAFKAIQEQQALITSLTTRITALETPAPTTPSTGTQV